jgi:hypothetical protein
MSAERRILLKVIWMAALIVLLVLFGHVHHEFVYQAF